MLQVEVYRMELYFNCRDTKNLKALKESYEFWEMAAPLQYREAWTLAKEKCIDMLKFHGVK